MQRVLFGIVLFGFLLLIIAQVFLVDRSVAHFQRFEENFLQSIMRWQFDHPEVKAVSQINAGALATVTLETIGYTSLQKAQISVNGHVVTDFRDKKVVIRVNPGDMITIDGSFYEQPFVIRVVQSSENVRQPARNEEFLVKDKLNIGPVVFE